MGERAVESYGSWRSPISADLVASGGVRLGQIALNGGDVYWIEGRPAEGGRNVIVRRTADGLIADLTPAHLNVRTRVHEYGGGEFAVADGTVYFSNFADGRLYRQERAGPPRPITPEAALRYADLIVDAGRNRLICVCEDHTVAGREAVNTLAAVDSAGAGGVRHLVSAGDFYSSPRLSPDGRQLAWLTWNHPNMPWDGCQLWTGQFTDDGLLEWPLPVAGGRRESIFQPEWSPDGDLYFVSDRTGWWNLYRQRNGQVEPMAPMEAEFGRPQWVFGLSTYAFAGPSRLVCAGLRDGSWSLMSLDTRTKQLTPLATPYTELGHHLRGSGGRVVFDASSATEAGAIVELDLESNRLTILRRAREQTIDAGYLSVPEELVFPTEHGLTAHGLYYRPQNQDFSGPQGERPPLIVKSHGGPTSATSAAFNPGIQYWTSRGFAVLDVNYGGSTGYGRAYRQRLDGQWGVVDVDDCVNGARYLVDRAEVDGKRLAITGGSAGGYTTLAALTFRDTFQAGSSHFGVSDLGALAEETHKYESRYLDRLVGPYPERRDLYRERSPIYHTDRLSCPMILFQGSEDKVVPPSQAELMVEALRRKGLPVAYLLFEGEQHGFRRAENVKRSLEAELYFYGRVFGFEPADAIEPVRIENLGE